VICRGVSNLSKISIDAQTKEAYNIAMANEINAASPVDARETDQILTEGELSANELDELSGGKPMQPGLHANCGTQDSGTQGCGG
jgi:hypothetical protein